MVFLNGSFLCGVLTGTSIYIAFKWMYDRIMAKTQVNELNDDCLLFWPRALTYHCLGKVPNPCKNFCCPNCNYNKFISLLNSTKETLDVCVYLITSKEITNVIINLFRKGVFVRIIVDNQMCYEAHNSKIYEFIKEHIPIKTVKTEPLMHNKFVIIDQKRVITGSFNWTNQATTFNYENGVIIHNARIIKKFNAYFHNIWHSF